MEIKDILVFLDADEPCEVRLDLAVELARRNGAALTGLCACPRPALDPADGFAIGPEAVGDVLTRRDAAIAQLLAPVEAAFHAAAAEQGIEGWWVVAAANETPDELAPRARCFDLAIVGRPASPDHAGQRLAEQVALFSGTPCLIAPEGARRRFAFERVLVAWNGRREAKRALQDGLMFIKRAKSVVLAVVDGETSAATDAAGEDDILRHLERHGVAADLQRLDARHEDAGAALLRQCERTGVELMIMGAYGHSRAAEMVLGGATRTVLGRASLPVLMSR